MQEQLSKINLYIESALKAGRGSGLSFHAAHYCSLGDLGSRGVAVLLRPGPLLSSLPTSAASFDHDGRVVRVDVDVFHYHLSFLCVYAPNDGRSSFFRSLAAHVPAGRLVFVGGDFNCICGPLDQSSSGTHRYSGSTDLTSWMASASLVDAFRELHPTLREYTHVNTARSSAARLDRFLIPHACMSWDPVARHVWGAPGDHAGVLLCLSLPGIPSLGPGSRSFPCFILREPSLLDIVSRQLAQFIAQIPVTTGGPGEDYGRWLEVKAFLLDLGRNVSATHLRRQAAQRRVAESLVSNATSRYASLSDVASGTALVSAIDALRREVWSQAQRMGDASAALWQAYGERCTSWHFAQAGSVMSKTPVAVLRDASGIAYNLENVSSGADLSPLTSAHFSSASPTGLFRVGDVDPVAQQELLNGLDRKLSQAQALLAEGPNGDGTISAQCLQVALSECANGKAPGRDGLPYEVYKVLWIQLGPLLVAAMNDIFANGAGGSEWAEGIILPIFKGKGLPADLLSSYRPITLLNCDLKLVSRVVCSRMQGPLDFLVDPSQTAFIKGRWIGDNVLLNQEIMEHMVAENQPGTVLFLDVAKAYDRVDRGWLLACANAMGLPVGMMSWIRRLSEGTRSRVCLNGWLTDDFPVDNGLPQGGPLAPPLWVLQLQPLTAALIRAQVAGTLRSPLLPSGRQVTPATHHADDTKIYLQDLQRDGPAAWHVIALYCDASNAQIHPDKSKGLCLGSHPVVVGRDPVTGAVFPSPGDAPLSALGIPCSVDMGVVGDEVYRKRVKSMQSAAYLWGQQPLSAVGRVLISKSVLCNSASYHATFVPPSSAHMSAMQRCIHRYVARSSAPEDATLCPLGVPTLMPNAAIACLPVGLGGMGLPDLPSLVTALQAKVVAQAFSPGVQPWKGLLLHALARAAPHPRWGPAWVVTELPISSSAGLSERQLALVTAFRRAGPTAAPAPTAGFPARALLLMPLYLNPHLRDSTGTVLSPPPSPSSDWPFTLGQLASCSQALQQDPQLQTLVTYLPPSWQQALSLAMAGEDALHASDEWWVSLCGIWVIQGRAGALSAAPCFSVVQSGLLVSVEGPPPPSCVWQPACVVQVPLHRSKWTQAEADAVRAAPPDQKHSLVPTAPSFLGSWSTVTIYPPAWGFSRAQSALTPSHILLHQYAVSSVRRSLTLQQAVTGVQHHDPGYVVGSGIKPRLWPGPSDGLGLVAMERSWIACESRKRNWITANPPLNPSWMQPRSSSQPASRRSRTSATTSSSQPMPQQPPTAAPPHQQVPQPRPEYSEYWAALWASPMPNRTKVFAYRLLHASLPCRALLGFMCSKERGYAACQCCHAVGGSTPRPLETYSHVFLECPTYRPAVLWLLDLWQHISGTRPPDCARVIVADEQGVWQQAPNPGSAHASLWMVLRTMLLQCIWVARESRDSRKQTAGAVVRSFIAAVRAEIQLHYNRSHRLSAGLLLDLPPPVLALHRLELRADDVFAGVWLDSGLCRVDMTSGVGGQPHLVLLLTAANPVAAPP